MSLNAHQTAHAKSILGEVKRHGLPKRAGVIAIETALVESNITIYANRNVAASMQIPHEAVGSDHASVGIFQQQVPSWGTAADCMDPARSARKFLDRLVTFNWASMKTGDAAQRVQVSAFPGRYQQQEGRATEIVDALWGASTGPRPVNEQQHAINALHYQPALAEDGKAGPRTVAGIKWLQRLVGASADGKWGADTEAKYVAYMKTHGALRRAS